MKNFIMKILSCVGVNGFGLTNDEDSRYKGAEKYTVPSEPASNKMQDLFAA